ncbi:3'(2'),5'-bisphosphate nucleotidase CysQ [Marinococcus luteus]|uniref:3'(2'),5'-bisphosphate nucleotidase CysQ n=1 Tax=Marinococcus luteus TaxID=1122204 RepID=UPI002ACCBEE7|nr:3'(2'),5'-bisphosphate nucleotidase CysQ [Marinococcus luteus]MDZ5784245.1 3'(2'),5'-bisphosphate nucleotidase CysQ [Marinococcus luteus]
MSLNITSAVIKIAIDAGREIMDVYRRDFSVEQKEDDSPLTEADKRAHNIIARGLAEADPETPVISEEGNAYPYEERKQWASFWLVDPLDGTKEFIKKNDEFTVNIAKIEDRYPVFGIIYVPAQDTLYIGGASMGAYKVEKASALEPIGEEALKQHGVKLNVSVPETAAHVVASRSHMSEETEAFINNLKETYSAVDVVSAGSSLKFCLVAEGKAHFYPRYAPTMEWDTGAGQAIVEAAGGEVIRHEDSRRFDYNREEQRNGWFLVQTVK